MAKELNQFGPDTDGFDHINILANKAKTVIGKRLSHFAHCPFVHPYYGGFQSMEGFWHYISSGFKHEGLREVYGFNAKKQGRDLTTKWYQHFCEDILAGNYQKIIQNPDLAQMMTESELPFTHYYLFEDQSNPGEQKVVVPRESVWLVQGFEDIRTALKDGNIPDCWKSATVRYATNIANGRPAYKSK